MSFVYRFTYDGTFEGFLCLVLRSVNMKVIPLEINVGRGEISDLAVEGRAMECHVREDGHVIIRTDRDLAAKLYMHIGNNISFEVQQMVKDYFLTSSHDMERTLLMFILRCLKFGPVIAGRYEDECVKRIHDSIRDLYREMHSVSERLVFGRTGGISTATIEPRNRIIPVLRPLVLARRELDDLILYDKRHKIILLRSCDNDMTVDVSAVPADVCSGCIGGGEGKSTGDSGGEDGLLSMWRYLISGEHIDRFQSMAAGSYGTAGNASVSGINGPSGARPLNALKPLWYIAS